MKRRIFLAILPCVLVAVWVLRPLPRTMAFTEGPVLTATVTVGPFDLHRRYRSMEGPYVQYARRVGDMLAVRETTLPERMVTFVEGGDAPAMMGGAPFPAPTMTPTDNGTLLWLKGLKVEVLDENDRVLPSAEFICHFNLDVDLDFRHDAFPSGERETSTRLATITQGQTEISFPHGYGVPVASNEVWSMVFQAANRTTDRHRRVKQRCTFYFIADKDLVYPVTAMNWYTPYVCVVIDKASQEAARKEKTLCPACLGMVRGVNAPNNTSNGTLTDDYGQTLSGHWVVPPGQHSWTWRVGSSFEFPEFSAKDRVIRAVWSHVHPLCTDLSLYRDEGGNRQLVFRNGVQTRTWGGLEITHIDFLSSPQGIPIQAGAPYELEVRYNNTTGQPLDSMAVAGIFCEDPAFARPAWAQNRHGYTCMPPKK